MPRLSFPAALVLLAVSSGAGAALVPSSRVGPAAPDAALARLRRGEPLRLVSAIISTDELLVDLLGASRLTAVSRFADDPQISNVVEAARRVAGRAGNDPERLLALRPELVFADAFGSPATDALLREARVPVVRIPSPSSLADIRTNVARLGEELGVAARAAEIVADMDRTLAEVEHRVRSAGRPRVLLYNRGGFTAGQGTLFDEQLRRARGRNVAAEAGIAGYAFVPVERAFALDPDVILVNDFAADSGSRAVAEAVELTTDPVWRHFRAVRTGRVHRLEERLALSTSHYAADAVVAIARVLHPELRWPE